MARIRPFILPPQRVWGVDDNFRAGLALCKAETGGARPLSPRPAHWGPPAKHSSAQLRAILRVTPRPLDAGLSTAIKRTRSHTEFARSFTEVAYPFAPA